MLVVALWVGRGRDGLKEGVFKKKRFGCQASKENGADRCEWRGFVRGEHMGRSPRDKPLALTICHSCGLPQLYVASEGWKSVCGRAYNLKGKFSVFLFFLN